DLTVPFDIDDYTRWRLLEGLDDIGLTLRHADDIAEFEAAPPPRLSETAGRPALPPIAGSPPGIGDLAEVGEDPAELCHAAFAEVGGPLGLHLRDARARRPHAAVPAFGDPHEPGPSVRRVGYPLDVAAAFELVDEESRALLGDRGLRGEVGQPAAIRREALEHPRLRRGEVGEPRHGQRLEHTVLH